MDAPGEREPDFEQFLKVLRRQGRPGHLPFYEHIASADFINGRLGRKLPDKGWSQPGYAQGYVEFWLGLGFDCVPMEIPLRIAVPAGRDGLSGGAEVVPLIRTMEDFEK